MSADKNETTRIIHAGYCPDEYHGVITPPVTRVSSIKYPSLAAVEDPAYKFDYGRNNTPLVENFTTAIAELEQAAGTLVAPCGLSAITASILSFVKNGDHMLVADSVYYPVRRFASTMLKDLGVEVTFYDPLIGADIESLIQDNTRIIFMETPGSGIFEIQDIPAIVNVAKAHDIITMVDNSWGSGVVLKPLTLGADISIISCTKYINGHADGMLGVASAADEKILRRLHKGFKNVGLCAGSEEVNLGMRGLKTVHVRMKEAQTRAMQVIEFLQTRNEVEQIYYPALSDHPNHDIWKRDFSGANGIFCMLLKDAPKDAIADFVESMEYFPLADSWGGYESLCQLQNWMMGQRTVLEWDKKGWLVRLQIGLEAPQDLINDLAQALDKYGENIK